MKLALNIFIKIFSVKQQKFETLDWFLISLSTSVNNNPNYKIYKRDLCKKIKLNFHLFVIYIN